MLLYTLISAVLFCGASANLRFKSRPDLAPPTLNISIPANDTAKGYIFFTPQSFYPDDTNHGPAQGGPYIVSETGDLVWSGFSFVGPRSENFQVHQYRGKDVLTIFDGSHNSPMGHGHGHTKIWDSTYRLIGEVRGGGHRLADHHEFQFFNDSSALFTVFQPEIRDLTPYGATTEDRQWILDNKIQKVDTNTGKMLWEWSSLEHIDPAGTNLTLLGGNAGLGVNSSQVWHYFYMNAFDVDPEQDVYLLSARSMCTVFKMDGKTGKTLWQLGGKNSSFSLGEGLDFCWQHDTRMHKRWLNHESREGKEIISFFDNSAHENLAGGPFLQTRAYSAGKIIELDTKKWTAKLLASFRVPGDLSVRSQGNVQLLPNGNAFINWGFEGVISEHKPDGTTVFMTRLDSGKLGAGVENYRAFKFDWHGQPAEDPAVVAFIQDHGVDVYVSWNGDTETVLWKFYDDCGKELGQADRKSFETKFTTRRQVNRVVAKAYNKHGYLLVTGETEATRYRAKLEFEA